MASRALTLSNLQSREAGLDHDPKGNFIREFVPELNHLSNDEIHLPNNIYTEPLVELKTSLSSAREAISSVRRSEGFRTIAKGVYDKLGSRKRSDKRKSNSQPNLLTRKQVTKLKNKKIDLLGVQNIRYQALLSDSLL